MKSKSKSREQGLSLLELLVVFVIVGLVSTLLMQGLGFGLSLFERVNSRSEVVKQEVLVRQWFRQVNQSLVAKVEERGFSLIGDDVYFEAETLNPLVAHPGVAKQIRWSVEDDVLWYEESGLKLQIMTLGGDAKLSYGTSDGRWFSEWPVNEDTRLLPKAIKIESSSAKPLVAALRVREKPDALLEESRRERE